MEEAKKKLWRKVLISQLISWVLCSVIVAFIYLRSGSLSAALTVGLALFLGSFRFTFNDYQQYKREMLEQENQGHQK